jgi:hypothetical protein
MVMLIALCFWLIIGCFLCISNNSMSQTSNSNISIWTDEETGVQYVIYGGYKQGGITPRLNADGSLHVENEESEE